MPTIEEDQDAILDRLRTVIPSVFESAIPDGYQLPLIENQTYFKPYAIVTFGGQSPVAMRNQSIGTSADDLKWTAVAIEVVAHTPRTARYHVAEVRKLLEGYAPSDNWGELSEILSSGYGVNVPDHDLWPVRYIQGIVFNTNVNAVRPN